MLDKYKDKNEFYSLVGIKCYSYVPSLLTFNGKYCVLNGISIHRLIYGYFIL
ncbi:hypothetical protein [Spiroplasma endosymbiont of Tipula paludosa]|uniref:hypothetical protein n=1 Tax=Spiroplasma endosymbiont of Tipula paludosa TaxID=3066295 RepID=UPI0035C91106